MTNGIQLSNRINQQRDLKQRSKSLLNQPTPIQKKDPTFKSLKLLGGQTVTLPTRERFNEEVESVIKENKEKSMHQTLNPKTVNILGREKGTSERSHMSTRSKKVLSAHELKQYFKNNEEYIKSRFSNMTRSSIKSGLKAKLMKKLERE